MATGSAILAGGLLSLLVDGLPYADARILALVPTGMLIIFVLAKVVRHGWSDFLDPAVMVSAGFLIFYSAGVIIEPANYASFYSDPSVSTPIISLYTGSVLLFLLGYSIGSKARLRGLQGHQVGVMIDVSRFWTCFLALTAALIGIMLVVSIRGNYPLIAFFLQSGYGPRVFSIQNESSLVGYLLRLLGILPIAVCILAATLLSLPGLSRVQLVGGLGVLAFCVAFLWSTGARFWLIYGAGGGLLLWYELTQRTDPAKLYRNKSSVLLACILIAWATSQQMVVRPLGGLAGYMQTGQTRLAGLQDVVEPGIDQLPMLEVITSIVPHERRYLLGATYLSPLFTLLPRAWWPAKPSDLAVYVEGYTGLWNANTAFGVLGELYANFGTPGVLVGMWLFGILAGRWRTLYFERRASLVVGAIYMMSLLVFAFVVRGSFHTAVAGMLYPALIVVPTLRLSLRLLHSSNR